MRYSRQREALLELLRSTKSHPDAEWLYEGLRKENPRISLGTVYRNLRQLVDEGDILELNYGTVTHYDGDISPHYHMQCDCCKRILDIPKENVDVTIQSELGIKIQGFSIMLNGLCPKCI